MKKGPIEWMAENHVASNLLMMVFLAGGLILSFSIKQEVFPEITLDSVSVSVAYPGAGPEEVEDGIILKIEESLSGVTGIKEVTATAGEGLATVVAEVLDGEDVEQVLQDIKSEVDRITTFPEEAEKAVVSKISNRREVVSLVLYGDAPERSLLELSEGVRDDLLAIEGITQVDIKGARPYEISVEAPEKNLRAYGLTLQGIARSIRNTSVDLPAGELKTESGEILLRTKEKRYTGQGLQSVPVAVDDDGAEVFLSDIADIKDGFADTDLLSRLDGRPAVMVAVYRVGKQKPLEISEKVKAYVEDKAGGLPPSVDMVVWNDYSDIYRSRMNLLIKNALIGLTLVFLLLGVFLQIRLALWVMLGIPISFLGAMLFMPSMDVSINMISLFAFILALGIVVDDAIVVGENVYAHRAMGKPYLLASQQGALEVARPVFFSIATTVTAFLPLVFISGNMGKFIRVIPLVVIPILIVSLIESLFVLPAHLSTVKAKQAGRKGLRGRIDRLQEGFAGYLRAFVHGPYNRVLGLAIEHRYATLAIGISMMLLCVGAVGGGYVKFRFMPEVDGDLISVNLKMPVGTPFERTSEAQALIEQKASEALGEFNRKEGKSILRHMYSLTGQSFQQSGPGPAGGQSDSNYASVLMYLVPSEQRTVKASAVSGKWRELVGEIPGAESLTFASNLIHFGENIALQATHNDFGVLQLAGEEIKKELSGYPGVRDITDSYSEGKSELKLTLKPEGRTLGLTSADLGSQVRAAYYGAEALRFQRGRNEVKVMVRYPENERSRLTDLQALRLRAPGGIEAPFYTAANISEDRGFSKITRKNRKRVLDVTASVDELRANAEEINADIKTRVLPKLQADYPGLAFNEEGQEKSRAESVESMRRGFLLALLGIYTLLAVPFRSYSQPLIVMSAIPFGLVGAVIGHAVMGFNLSMLSLFGSVALAGVVVNDSLLLIDFINRARQEGKGLVEAVTESGKRRFRPILLTSLTTFFGLAPMIAETSIQAQFLIPMAISLGFGILFATGITLLLVPAMYMILEDLKRVFGMRSDEAIGS